MRLGYLSVPESRKALRIKRSPLKGQRKRPEGSCPGQIQDNLIITENNDCDYKVLNNNNNNKSLSFAVIVRNGGDAICHQLPTVKFVIKGKEFSIYLAFLGETVVHT